MDPVLLRLLLVLAIVAGTAVGGWWWRRREGRVHELGATDGSAADGAAAAGPVFADEHLDEVGLELDGAPAGAVLLSSPTCASCGQVRRILAEVTEERADFRWVSVDAGEHLDLVRAHHVMRVPTLFLLGADGRILARTSGVPARHELERIVDRAGAHSGT